MMVFVFGLLVMVFQLHAATFSSPVVIPKADLHVHLEAANTMHQVLKAANKKGIVLNPEAMKFQEDYSYQTFQPFADAYTQITRVLTSAKDYDDLAYRVLAGKVKEGCILAELKLAPQWVTQAETVGWQDMLIGANRGIERAK